MRHQAHGSRRIPERPLDFMRVDDEERDRKRRLVFLWSMRPVVAHVGFQTPLDSPRVAGAQLVLKVKAHLEVSGQNLPNGIRAYRGPAPVDGAVGLGGRDRPQQFAVRCLPCRRGQLREEPRDPVRVPRLAPPRVDPVADVSRAASAVLRYAGAPYAPVGGKLGAVSVGKIADTFCQLKGLYCCKVWMRPRKR